MNRKAHLWVNALILTALSIYLYYASEIHPLLLVIGVYLGINMSIAPDLDAVVLGKVAHRHVLFHSILIPLPLWALGCVLRAEYPSVFLTMAFIMLSYGLHLLLDVKLFKSQRVGFYCVKYRYTLSGGTKGFNGFWSSAWLAGNFIGSIILFIITLQGIT